MRFAYMVAGLFLAGNAVYIGFRLYDADSRFILAAVAPALLAALALGALLIVKNVKPAPVEPANEETPE